jgi:hypothetical protein
LKKEKDTTLDLDQGSRDDFEHDIHYNLDMYNQVRAKTITELKRDRTWFA